MGLAVLTSQRSKDPNTKVGSCIVNSQNRVVSVGYNGFPIGCSDLEFPWTNDKQNNAFENTKYAYVVHSEANAIINKNDASLKDCTLYTTLFCCCECAKLIIQSGIKKIVYLDDKYHDEPSSIASRRMFDATGVTFERYSGRTPTIKFSE
jgi:dCMP deaminase